MSNLVNTWKRNYPTNEEWLAKVCIPVCLEKAATNPQASRVDIEATEPKNENTENQFYNADTSNAYCKSNQQERPSPMQVFSRPIKSREKVCAKMTSSHNKLGEKLVVPPFDGLILVILWIDSKLSNLEHVVSDDGLSVMQRKKVPNPKSAAQLLAKCPFANFPYHVVTKTLEQALQPLKPKEGNGDRWIDSVCVTLNEEVMPAFVNVKGNQTDDVAFDVTQMADR